MPTRSPIQVPATNEPSAMPSADLCACSPSQYTFLINFNTQCPPPGVAVGPGTGIDRVECSVTPSDGVPASIQTFSIAEFGTDGQLLARGERDDIDITSGFAIQFTSTSDGGVDIPSSIQVEYGAVDANGNPVTGSFSIFYTNECGIEPVLSTGDTLTWTIISGLTPANADLCPNAPPPSPTVAPTTAAPTDEICACSPTEFSLLLDFEEVCPPPGFDVGEGTGISSFDCNIQALDNSVTDLVPVRIVGYNITEFDRDLERITGIERIDLDLTDDFVIFYRSFTFSGVPSPELIPGAFEVIYVAENANGDILLGTWSVVYSNECDVLAFETGDSTLWATIANLGTPSVDFCPVAPAPTPTASPVTPAPVPVTCSCSPLEYTFLLDFATVCPPPGFDSGPGTGISAFACDVSADEGIQDLVPVQVTAYSIVEFNTNFQIIAEAIDGDLDLLSGSTIRYESFVKANGIPSPSFVPGGLRVSYSAVNANGDALLGFFVVQFSNDCDTSVFDVGDTGTWTVFSALERANPEFCPAASAPTPAPVTPEPTTQVCSCSPLQMSLTLDFDAVCPPPGFAFGPGTGISDFECSIVGAESTTTDLVPIVVISYRIDELDQDGQRLAGTRRARLDLLEGTTIVFTFGAVPPDFIAGGFRVSYVGENAAGEEILGTWSVTYSNDCNVFPFSVMDTAVWTTISSVVDADNEDFCNAVV